MTVNQLHMSKLFACEVECIDVVAKGWFRTEEAEVAPKKCRFVTLLRGRIMPWDVRPHVETGWACAVQGPFTRMYTPSIVSGARQRHPA